MSEFGPNPETEPSIGVKGDRELIRKKLLVGKLGVAFLMSEKDFTIYVSPDNSHINAAKMANLPSNNARGILLKGRIVPKLESFDFINNSNALEGLLANHQDEVFIDRLVPEVVTELKDWLGEEFKNYSTHYKRRSADGKRTYGGD